MSDGAPSYRRACRVLAEAARLLSLAIALDGRAPRGAVDGAPLAARALALLRQVDGAGEDASHAAVVNDLARRHLDLGRVGAQEVERYGRALRWARKWHRQIASRARARASPDDRARERRRRLRGVAIRVIAAVLGVVVSAGAVESWLRLRARSTLEDGLRRAELARPPAFIGGCDGGQPGADLREMVRPSAFPDLVYDLKPDVDTCFKNARVTTNHDGQRASVSYSRAKPQDTYRIVLLGDSNAFGWGVAQEDIFATRMQSALAAASGRSVEIINLAVPGYNTAMEVASYLAKGAAYSPDCVMVLFCGNDLSVPFLMRESVRKVHGSYLLGALVAPGAPAPPDFGWFHVAEGPLLASMRDEEAEGVPDEYRHMVGLSGYRSALSRLAVAAAAKGTTVVSFADYRPVEYVAPPEEFIAFQRKLGIVVPAFVFPAESTYWLSLDDPHPNVEGHAELSRRMLAGLATEAACMPPR
jgi:lysophospholipase L1-like esterase